MAVRLFQGAAKVRPQVSLGDLELKGGVDFSAVFIIDYEVEFPGGVVQLRVRPAFGVPGWWDGQRGSSSRGVREVFGSQWWSDFEEFWELLVEEKPEETRFLERMFNDPDASEVIYMRFINLSVDGDRLEALAGGYFWTLTVMHGSSASAGHSRWRAWSIPQHRHEPA